MVSDKTFESRTKFLNNIKIIQYKQQIVRKSNEIANLLALCGNFLPRKKLCNFLLVVAGDKIKASKCAYVICRVNVYIVPKKYLNRLKIIYQNISLIKKSD